VIGMVLLDPSRILDVSDLRATWLRRGSESGFFTAEALTVFTELLIDGLLARKSNAAIASEMRKLGRPMTPEERAAAGVNPRNRPLSFDFWRALTEEGRKAPYEAIETIVARVAHECWCRANLAQARRLMPSGGTAQIMTVPDDRCCAGSHRIAGKIFPLDQAPPLPLPGCTAIDWCRCTYTFDIERK
jgi:hypothetical protein